MEIQAPEERPAGPSREALTEALRRLEGQDVEILSSSPVAGDRAETELKHIGYGEPTLVCYRSGGSERRVVFRTMLPNWFGHDRRSDRATLALLAFDTYGSLPDHVRALDVGVLDRSGDLVSLRQAGEFYLVTTYADGRLYAEDLRRIERIGRSETVDVARAKALAGYLVDLHGDRHVRPHEAYVRAIRDLVGSGEGIFGIADSYAPDGPISFERLMRLEQRSVAWRWRLRRRARRIRRTHGDFHPYNVLFRHDADFTLLDGSRGGEGEPADDVAAMTINYVFGGVVHPEAWRDGLKPLWDTFWRTYLHASGDWEILETIAPFFAWRALVVASPVWYPDISNDARDALVSFAEQTLDAPSFDPEDADRAIQSLRCRSAAMPSRIGSA